MHPVNRSVLDKPGSERAEHEAEPRREGTCVVIGIRRSYTFPRGETARRIEIHIAFWVAVGLSVMAACGGAGIGNAILGGLVALIAILVVMESIVAMDRRAIRWAA